MTFFCHLCSISRRSQQARDNSKPSRARRSESSGVRDSETPFCAEPQRSPCDPTTKIDDAETPFPPHIVAPACRISRAKHPKRPTFASPGALVRISDACKTPVATSATSPDLLRHHMRRACSPMRLYSRYSNCKRTRELFQPQVTKSRSRLMTSSRPR